MKMTLRTAAIATSTFVFASAFSLGWSEQGSLSLSISKADAVARVYVRGYTRSVYGLGGPSWRPLVRREGLLHEWPLEWPRVELGRLG